MTRAGRTALTLLGTLFAVLGLLAGYVKLELAEPEPFAERGVAALQSDAVRAAIAEQVAVQLLERRSPDLVATRPLVLTAVEAVLETPSFERVLRRALVTTHQVLVRGDSDVTVELGQLREVLLPALRSASPALAEQVPGDLRAQIADVRASDLATTTVRTARSASVAALPLLLLALGCFTALVALAADRRRALGQAGLALAVGAAAGVVAVVVLRAQVVAHAQAVGALGRDEVRAAAGAAFDAFAADLQRLFVVVGTGGLALWAGALLAEARIDRRAALARVGDVVAGGRLPWPARLARGLAVAALGALVLLREDPVFGVAIGVLGGGLVLLGLTEAVAVARRGRLPATSPALGRGGRWGLLAAGVVLAGVIAAVLLTRGGTPAPLEAEEIRACNGLPELCDRRLDQVVLPGTHNAMSAADRPGWLFANQTRPVPRQLEDGIRLLLLDPHYGVVDREGRVRTDLEAEGTTRNRAAAQLGADAVRAAERLSGRLGLVPARGERRIFLCHTLCELGATGLGGTLREIRGFLEQHRAEVLVLDLESSVRPAELEEAFADADLEDYLAVLPRRGPLPTLRRLIETGRRLVVLDERDGGTAPWYQPGALFVQSTNIDAFTEDRTSCAPGSGGPDSPLLQLNHWVDRFPPPATAAAAANRRSVLLRRVSACRERLGRAPNLIAVDFYERGDVVAVARELNRAGPLARGSR